MHYIAKGCELHSIATSSGSLTAQKREKPSEDTGYSFANCKVTGSGTIFLGRAWGAYSRVVFLFTYIDDIIVPAGWNDFGDSSHQQYVTYFVTNLEECLVYIFTNEWINVLEKNGLNVVIDLRFYVCRTSFYGEYQCSGPGADAKNRVAWSYQLTASQAAPFETISFIDGDSWL